MELVIESTCVTDSVPVIVAPPQRRGRGVTILACNHDVFTNHDGQLC